VIGGDIMDDHKLHAFVHNIALGATAIQSFDAAFFNQKNLNRNQKQKAIEILMSKEKTKELLKQYRIYPKKTTYSMQDIENDLVSIAESSISDFLMVAPDSSGGQKATFRPLESADIRNIKSLEVRRDGTIKVTLYDRLDALKAIAILQQAKQAQNHNLFDEIKTSLSKVLQDIPKRLEAENDQAIADDEMDE
jgi:hypothetical protein